MPKHPAPQRRYPGEFQVHIRGVLEIAVVSEDGLSRGGDGDAGEYAACVSGCGWDLAEEEL